MTIEAPEVPPAEAQAQTDVEIRDQATGEGEGTKVLDAGTVMMLTRYEKHAARISGYFVV